MSTALRTLSRPPIAGPVVWSPPRLLQSARACGGSAGISGECESCRLARLLPSRMPKMTNDWTVPAIVHEVLRSSGEPLDVATPAFMEPRFGRDFSKVRVRRDSNAAQSADAVKALAYTVGRDVVFRARQYRPETEGGRKLLGHELAPLNGPGNADTPREVEPEKVANAVTSGQQSFNSPAPAVSRLLQRQGEAGTEGVPTSSGAPMSSGASGCSAVPVTTPATCAGRHAAYAAARKCFPLNSWLACVDRASADLCRAIEALSFTGSEGTQLRVCVALDREGDPAMTRAKAAWFNLTNSCIWGHWRAALDALHDPTLPVASALTPEWAGVVARCRRDGVGSGICCHARVVAEQAAIDTCGPYDSVLFGRLPTDVPCSPLCSGIVLAASPPPAFTDDFGKLRDRISYGDLRCCTF
jgi:uncharacterized protein DUF4157